MIPYLTEAAETAIDLVPLRKAGVAAWLETQPEAIRRWMAVSGFEGDAGTTCPLPAPDGGLALAVAGLGEEGDLWDWAAIPAKLPRTAFRIAVPLTAEDAWRAAFGWALAGYGFRRYREVKARTPTLVIPDGCDRVALERTVEAVTLVRDLINTPALDLGPEELAAAAAQVAQRHGAAFRVIVGDDLPKEAYPAIHAVGRGSARAPRLIDLRWGDPEAPKVTLVGKGVCFDSGGLDIKPSSSMKLMKKDMGGAACVLGLALMIMDALLPVRLRVLIPAVENSISGTSLRPSDVIPTRSGKSVEIGNTDAEGRVILADALTEAASELPELLVDCATLTGAARSALGTEVPALFCNDDAIADSLLSHGRACEDPLWRLPLWRPYRRHIESRVADLTNNPDSSYGGAITAALFLQEFVGAEIPWIHIDMMAWNLSSRPGRPEGGEAQGLRALHAFIAEKFPRRPIVDAGG